MGIVKGTQSFDFIRCNVIQKQTIKSLKAYIFPEILKYWVGPLSWASLTSCGEGASLALVGHPSSDGGTIKMPYGVGVLHRSDDVSLRFDL